MRKGSKKQRLTFDIPSHYSTGGALSPELIKGATEIAGMVGGDSKKAEKVEKTGNTQLDFYNSQMQHADDVRGKVIGNTVGAAAGIVTSIFAPPLAPAAFGLGKKLGTGASNLFSHGGDLNNKKKRGFLEEKEFRREYKKHSDATGNSSNPYDAEHYYNYSQLFDETGGIMPSLTKDLHLPSRYKELGHPNRFINGVDTTKEYAEGGKLTYYNTGGTHEQNANGGVVLGNTGNSVEEGEYRMDDRVLSKKLGYADQMKKWEKKSKLRPNDSLTKELIAQKFDKLYEQQEAFKKQAQVQAQEQTMYAAYGGKLGFGGVGEDMNQPPPKLTDKQKADFNTFRGWSITKADKNLIDGKGDVKTKTQELFKAYQKDTGYTPPDTNIIKQVHIEKQVPSYNTDAVGPSVLSKSFAQYTKPVKGQSGVKYDLGYNQEAGDSTIAGLEIGNLGRFKIIPKPEVPVSKIVDRSAKYGLDTLDQARLEAEQKRLNMQKQEKKALGGDLKSPYSVKDSTTIANGAAKDKNKYELKVTRRGDILYKNGKETNFNSMNALNRDIIRLKIYNDKIAAGADPKDLQHPLMPVNNPVADHAEGGNLGDMMSTPGFERAPLATKDFVLKPGNQTPRVNSEYVSMIPAFHNSMNVLPKTNSKSNKYKYSIGSNPDGVSDMISQYFYSEPQQLQNNPYNKRYLQNLRGQQLPQYYQNQHQQYLQQNNNPSEFILDVTPSPSYENNYMRDKNNKVINPGLQEGKQEPVQTPITTYAQNTRQVPQMGTPAQDNMNFAAYGGQLVEGGGVGVETEEEFFKRNPLLGLDASMLSNENPNNPAPYSLPEGVVAPSIRRLPMNLMPTLDINGKLKGGSSSDNKKPTATTTDKKTDTKSNVPQNKYSPLGMIAQAASPLYQGALGLLNKDTVNFEAPTLQGINPYYQARLQEAQINEQLNASRNAFRNNANTQGTYLAGVTNLGAFGADTAGRQIGEIYGQANQYNNSINNQNIAARVANANLNQDTRQREKDASRTAINMALQGAGQGIATGVKDKYAAQSNNLYNTSMNSVIGQMFTDYLSQFNPNGTVNINYRKPTVAPITAPEVVPTKKKYGGSLYKRGGKLMNHC
jgi:hypothetical protein